MSLERNSFTTVGTRQGSGRKVAHEKASPGRADDYGFTGLRLSLMKLDSEAEAFQFLDESFTLQLRGTLFEPLFS